MNSNLFTKPLDTSHAMTFFGIEALMYQGENFLTALANCVRRLKEKNKYDSASIKEAGLGECIEKFTGMNATVNILPGYAAHVYLPPLDGSHPFHRNWFADEPLFSTAGEVILRGKGDPIAEIDFEKARVGGVYAQVPVNIYIGTWLIKGGLSVEEVAAIILHEVGHAFTYFYYLGRMYFANFLISSYAQEIIGTRDVGRRKILLKAAEKRIGLEIHNPNALAEQPSLNKDKLETLFINSHRYTLATATGTDIYDFRSCEQLADYFATMHGGGPFVISGLNKIYEACGDTSIMPMPIVIFGEVAKWIMLPLMVPLLLGTLLTTNPAIKSYDDPKARAKYIEMQLKGVLKNRNMPAETRKSLLASIDACGHEIKRLNDFKGMEHMVWSILSPTYRRGVKQEQSQKVLEGILFNDLYQKAAIFDSMEELNPLIDDMVVAIAESRQEALEADELNIVNNVELESDINYLYETQGDIIENGVASVEQINSIQTIVKKYGLDTHISTEQLTVSNEGISALAIGAITIAIAAVIAVIWKLMAKMNGSSDKIGNSTANATKHAPVLKQAETVMSNVSSQKPVVKAVIVKAKEAGVDTVAELDKLILGDKPSEYKPKTTEQTREWLLQLARNNAPKDNTQTTPVKPKGPRLTLVLPSRMSLFGRMIDDEFQETNPSFRKLYNAHLALDPSLTKKFGIAGLETTADLEIYLDYFFKDTIKGHLHQYVRQHKQSYVNKEIYDHFGLTKAIDKANGFGNELPGIVTKLLSVLDSSNINKYLNTLANRPDGERRYNNRPLSFGNYLYWYFNDTTLSNLVKTKGVNVPTDYSEINELGKLWGGDVGLIIDSPIIKNLGSFKCAAKLDVESINVTVAQVTKDLERNKERYIKSAGDLFEKEFSKVDKWAKADALDRAVANTNKQIGKYLADIATIIRKYESNLAALSSWLLFIDNHMDRMIKFHSAARVLYIEYANTPG